MYRDVLYADLAGALIGDVQGCTVCRFRLKRLLLVQEQKSVTPQSREKTINRGAHKGRIRRCRLP